MSGITVFLIDGGLNGGHMGSSHPADTTLADSSEGLKDNVEVEVLTLRPAGFEPAEIVRPTGSFVLFIDDRSGKRSSSLVLQREKGERVRTISLNRKKSEWNDVVDLPPGTYVLLDAGNPELRCHITILP
jgi:hypothetical protein